MEQKPGWSYYFIDSLNQHIAINDTTGILYTEDKTLYTVEECNLLKKIDYKLPQIVHMVKKAVKGTIIQI